MRQQVISEAKTLKAEGTLVAISSLEDIREAWVEINQSYEKLPKNVVTFDELSVELSKAIKKKIIIQWMLAEKQCNCMQKVSEIWLIILTPISIKIGQFHSRT